MEETLEQEIENKRQDEEEEQGGFRRRLRDRELLKRRRAEAEERETYQWVSGLESMGKRQKAEQRRSTKRRGRPRKNDSATESSFSQEEKIVDPEDPAVVVLPQSVEVVPALASDSLPTAPGETQETFSTWLPNPVRPPVPDVALVSPPGLVQRPITVPPAPSQDPATAPDVEVLPALAQDLASVPDEISAADLALPSTAVLPDQALAPDSDLIPPPAPVQELTPPGAQSTSLDPNLVPAPATVPPASAQDLSTAPVQYSAPDLVPASAPDVVLLSALSQDLISEAAGAPASVPQRVETLSTESQDRDYSDPVLIEDLGPDELKNDVPSTQDKNVSKEPSNNEPE